MPIKKSAKKANKRSEVLRAKNLGFEADMKNTIRGAKKDILTLSKSDKKDPAQAVEILKTVYSKIDKAVKVGVVKKNTAARRKSRLTRFFNKILAA